MAKIDPRCLVCRAGVKSCIERAEAAKRRKIKNLYPGHLWTIKWCPYKTRGPWFKKMKKAFSPRSEKN